MRCRYDGGMNEHPLYRCVLCLFGVLLFTCTTVSVATAGTEPIVTSDLLRIRSVSSIDVAQDGSRAVVAVRSIGERRIEPNDLRTGMSVILDEPSVRRLERLVVL